MMIEMILFLTLVVAMGAIIVKAYEWRQDVLYGPYIGPAFSHQNQRRIPDADELKNNQDISVASKIK